jgi:undecaprenyl-diphosphatase
MFSRPALSTPSMSDVALAAAGLLALALFAGTAAAVASGRAAAFDLACATVALHAASPAASTLLRTASALAELPSVVAVVAAIALWRFRRADPRGALQLIAVALAEEVLNALLKHLFHRARPELGGVETFSFPSGHAMAATATYGMVAILAARAYPALRWPLALAAAACALLIGASRVFLGVHWASDVLGGFAAGALVLIVAARATRPTFSGLSTGPC